MKENWNVRLMGSFAGVTELEISAVKHWHLADAVAEMAGTGPFPREGDYVILQGLYLAEGKAHVSGEGRRFASDPPSIGWEVKWDENYRRLECRRSDWTEEEDGKERWVHIYPAPGARISHTSSIYDIPGSHNRNQGEWILAGGVLIPSPKPDRYVHKEALRKALKGIKHVLREQEEATIMMVADILGVSVD